ncbi:MAG: DUF4445 domain-containing protein [Bacteroidales bacterium]|nr:DUF4445 domain-containing protein [Bacteroidales bacterium]
MNLFSPHKILVDKQIILKIMECKHGSHAFKIVNSVYETILDKAYSLVQPKGVIITGGIPDFFYLREKENFRSGVFCIATLGKDISEESSSLFSAGEYLEGLLLNTIADQMLINLTTAMYQEKILPFVRKKEDGISYRYIPGCQNVPIEYQKHILDLVGSEAKNEISITEGMMLVPVKSTVYFYVTDKSLPIRINDRDCRKCDMKDCKYRTILYVGITVIAGDKKIRTTLLKEMTLLEGLREQGWGVETHCNGAGYCGKCKVLMSGKVPEPGSIEKELISQKELQKGIRLACRVKSLDGMVVHLPEKTKTGYQIEQGFRCRKDKWETDSIAKSNSIVNIKKNGENTSYGIAVDIGTTTIVLALVDLVTGKTVELFSFLNPQREFGDDVITRIQFASTKDKVILTRLIRESLIRAVTGLVKKNDISVEQIREFTMAGNTTMIHLLLGLPVKSLAISPFKPVTLNSVNLPAAEILNDDFSSAEMHIFPGVSAYVGPDIVSGMYNRSFEDLKEITLFVDLGTNGEIVLGDMEKILCVSAAAGPAFEGARISCGTGCVSGAISYAGINKGKVWYSTIKQQPAVGLCGSGLVDLVAASLDAGIIDKSGLMKPEYRKDGLFIEKDSDGNEMRLTQKDIRELQLAKSAIRAGIEILIEEFDVTNNDIRKVYLAGGFGNYINADSAVRIGLLPKKLRNHIVLAGNSSLGGAVDSLLNPDKEEKVMEILKKVHYIELSSNRDFNDKFAEYMLFNDE